ncbi:MAG: hypothetical protein AAFR33_11480 [Pseudomonadota bacterium]
MSIRTTLMKAALAAGASFALAGMAHAQKTEAGTSVDNVFALDYSVGGVQQGRITNDPTADVNTGYAGPPIVDNGDGATSFTVDRLVDFILQELNSPLDTPPGATQVTPTPTGATAAARELAFSLTNNGNDHSSYSFQIEEITGVGADEFLSTNRTIRFYRPAFDLDGVAGDSSGCEAEQNEVITVTPIVPTTAGSGDANFVVSGGQLTCDLAPGETAFVFIGADIPNEDTQATPQPVTEGDTDNIYLIAQARFPQEWISTNETMGTGATGPGAVFQNDTGGNTLAGSAEVVLAEGDGPATGDAATDGVFSTQANWVIIDPDLTATKAVELLDQTATAAACGALVVPGTGPAPTSEYYIPGSCVRYTITVTNTADADASDADGVSLTDPLPAAAVYVSHTLGGDFVGGTVEVDTTLAGTTDCTANTDAGCVVKVTGTSLPANTTVGADSVGTLEIRAWIP